MKIVTLLGLVAIAVVNGALVVHNSIGRTQMTLVTTVEGLEQQVYGYITSEKNFLEASAGVKGNMERTIEKRLCGFDDMSLAKIVSVLEHRTFPVFDEMEPARRSLRDRIVKILRTRHGNEWMDVAAKHKFFSVIYGEFVKHNNPNAVSRSDRKSIAAIRDACARHGRSDWLETLHDNAVDELKTLFDDPIVDELLAQHRRQVALEKISALAKEYEYAGNDADDDGGDEENATLDDDFEYEDESGQRVKIGPEVISLFAALNLHAKKYPLVHDQLVEAYVQHRRQNRLPSLDRASSSVAYNFGADILARGANVVPTAVNALQRAHSTVSKRGGVIQSAKDAYQYVRKKSASLSGLLPKIKIAQPSEQKQKKSPVKNLAIKTKSVTPRKGRSQSEPDIGYLRRTNSMFHEDAEMIVWGPTTPDN